MFQPVAGAPFGYLSGWGGADLWYAFTTRDRGVSTGRYRSLNLGLHVGDDPRLVIANRERLFAESPWSLDQAVAAEQVHGGQVAIVGELDQGRGSRHLQTAVPGCDALVTGRPDVPLMALFADCAPVFFYAPTHKVIGLAHAGWRGVIAGVVPAVLRLMQQTYHIQPAHVHVAIGPCIGPCCYEIGPEVAERFYESGLGAAVLGQPARLHLEKALTAQLEEWGVLRERIVTAAICTHCRDDLFFSYRRDGGVTGRMGAVIGLRRQ